MRSVIYNVVQRFNIVNLMFWVVQMMRPWQGDLRFQHLRVLSFLRALWKWNFLHIICFWFPSNLFPFLLTYPLQLHAYIVCKLLLTLIALNTLLKEQQVTLNYLVVLSMLDWVSHLRLASFYQSLVRLIHHEGSLRCQPHIHRLQILCLTGLLSKSLLIMLQLLWQLVQELSLHFQLI